MKTVLSIAAIAGVAAAANAGLVDWDFTGAPGNQVSTAGTSSDLNVTASAFGRGAGLVASSAGNSISSSGWDASNADDYFSFGFSVASGYSVDLTQLLIATRSSGTGPGTLGLYYSGDGFSAALATFTQNNTAVLNSAVGLSLTGLTGAVEFRIIEIGDTQADGSGSTASGGTFRVQNYSDGTSTVAVQFIGTVVPTPGSLALLGLGGLAAARRRR